jgi:protein-tyrosine phosphatase
MVAELRAEGKTVLLHCVQAHSRTPAVAALYAHRLTGRSVTDCLEDIRTVLPSANPNGSLRAALDRLS